ncbi:2TM domain-containing protein [Tenacibaculum sp. 1_MG-2023]|uniref:2TM domain-containing protein n=1 Tax=Tenacibaculum sp. 1_MG-2023 TaxID=3062653 RepID=UPI0026E12774|nr:2TM domain-containing protein [Tenacibaculum sp. 1_MG-2023]MDO6675943.1 2TM domain-containing protein [Tenacibaculum sp. 1_MG-2023]
METINREQQYIRAQKRVDEIKKFYKHLVVYMLINLVFIGRRIYKDIVYRDESVMDAFLDISNYNLFFLWGVIVFLHGFSVFAKGKLFSKKWEERKIKEYMNK